MMPEPHEPPLHEASFFRSETEAEAWSRFMSAACVAVATKQTAEGAVRLADSMLAEYRKRRLELDERGRASRLRPPPTAAPGRGGPGGPCG